MAGRIAKECILYYATRMKFKFLDQIGSDSYRDLFVLFRSDNCLIGYQISSSHQVLIGFHRLTTIR